MRHIKNSWNKLQSCTKEHDLTVVIKMQKSCECQNQFDLHLNPRASQRKYQLAKASTRYITRIWRVIECWIHRFVYVSSFKALPWQHKGTLQFFDKRRNILSNFFLLFLPLFIDYLFKKEGVYNRKYNGRGQEYLRKG